MESLPFFIENEVKRQKLCEQGVEEKELPKPLGLFNFHRYFIMRIFFSIIYTQKIEFQMSKIIFIKISSSGKIQVTR